MVFGRERKHRIQFSLMIGNQGFGLFFEVERDVLKKTLVL